MMLLGRSVGRQKSWTTGWCCHVNCEDAVFACRRSCTRNETRSQHHFIGQCIDALASRTVAGHAAEGLSILDPSACACYVITSMCRQS